MTEMEKKTVCLEREMKPMGRAQCMQAGHFQEKKDQNYQRWF